MLNLIYAILKLLPVREKVTFVSRQANCKTEDMILLEQALRERTSDIELFFLCKRLEDDFISKFLYCFHIFRQMYHIATSKVVILDSYCISISALRQRKSLTVIQMWHALGSLKKFGLSIIGEGEGRDRVIASTFSMHKNYSYILTSSEACLGNFGDAFGYSVEHLRVMSLPRVDKITDKTYRKDAICRIHNEYPDFIEKKVVVYAPTLRKDRDISEEIEALAKAFSSSGYIFVVKKHPLMSIECDVVFMDEKFTTLEMLFAADYVICDYSAVVFEAAIMGKPLFFYAFDYESYGVERDFYIDYKTEMPGMISGNPQEIFEAVASNRYDLEKVKQFADKYVEYQEHCSDRLAEFVTEKM